jgi:hypothetical protein
MGGFADTDDAATYARSRWEDGERRVQRLRGSARRATVERVVEAILRELERRIGGTFDTIELARLQDVSEDWCTSVAHEAAPDDPWAWDLDMVQGAAFYRFARRASDYQSLTGE